MKADDTTPSTTYPRARRKARHQRARNVVRLWQRESARVEKVDLSRDSVKSLPDLRHDVGLSRWCDCIPFAICVFQESVMHSAPSMSGRRPKTMEHDTHFPSDR